VPKPIALLSPCSIQAALAMYEVYAAGDTRAEMAKVVHPFVTYLSPIFCLMSAVAGLYFVYLKI
jgi:hypothetical protein